jgi:hypothetical protein
MVQPCVRVGSRPLPVGRTSPQGDTNQVAPVDNTFLRSGRIYRAALDPWKEGLALLNLRIFNYLDKNLHFVAFFESFALYCHLSGKSDE